MVHTQALLPSKLKKKVKKILKASKTKKKKKKKEKKVKQGNYIRHLLYVNRVLLGENCVFLVELICDHY